MFVYFLVKIISIIIWYATKIITFYKILMELFLYFELHTRKYSPPNTKQQHFLPREIFSQ